MDTAAPRQVADVARIISKQYPATTGTCMKFWYYVVGNGLGELNVYIETNGNKGPSQWTIYSGFDFWMITEIPVQSSYPFRVSSII